MYPYRAADEKKVGELIIDDLGPTLEVIGENMTRMYPNSPVNKALYENNRMTVVQRKEWETYHPVKH